MAYKDLRMQALGSEECSGCGERMTRGSTMTVVISDKTGDSLGWFCEACIRDWQNNGNGK